MKRVAVTGVGVISPVGNNAADFFASLMAGRSGIRKITKDFASQLFTKVAAEADFNPREYFSKKQADSLDRVSQFALVAAKEAWKDSGLDLQGAIDKSRAGVYMGTGLGGAGTLEESYHQLFRMNSDRLKPFTVLMTMNNAAASHVSMDLGLTGSCVTYSVACASSAVAVGEAFRQIRHGYADIMLAGGTDALLTYGVFRSWEALRILAVEDAVDPSATCKPFSKDRTGLVLGEGASVIVLEDMERAIARGARIYAELCGYGITADAGHITAPSLDGQAGSISMAIKDAGLSPDDVDYINAHGTATTLNDLVETQAIKKVFGERAYKVPVSATKSMHGHLMGATGAVEFAATVLAMRNNAIPPTMNLNTPDPECDLDYVSGKGRQGVTIGAALSNSFAFGGTNAVLAVKAFK